jgi:hypothetical protein
MCVKTKYMKAFTVAQRVKQAKTLTAWPLKMELIAFPETSVTNY